MANKWFAVFAAFLLPPAAFMYLAKYRLAICYCIFWLAAVVGDFIIESTFKVSILRLLVVIGAMVHAFKLAKSLELPAVRNWYNTWWGVLSAPISLFAVAVLLRCFVFEIFSIPSASMSPGVEKGEYIWVKKWGYGNYGAYGITLFRQDVDSRTPLLPGEIVVFNRPNDSRGFVSRIIGVPGDSIIFADKQLIINGTPIASKNISVGFIREVLAGRNYDVKYINDRNNFREGEWQVPDGHYFLMSDNRDNALDSRAWGALRADYIIGRVSFKW